MANKRCLVCNCNGSMPLDGALLGRALGLDASLPVATELCRSQIGHFEAAVRAGDDLVVACTQEASLFGSVCESLELDTALTFCNLRELAGWSDEAAHATPKMAALLAAAMLPPPEPVTGVSYRSSGKLLIVGPAVKVLPWIDTLADQFDVSVLLTSSQGGELPAERKVPLFSGRVTALSGYLGAFDVAWAQDNPIDLEACTRCGRCIRACPEQAIDFSYQVDLDKCKAHRRCVQACGGIGAIDFARAERARSERYDLVLDLSARPLIDVAQPPQGYLAPGEGPVGMAQAIARLTGWVGEFEKPKFFQYRQSLCAHGRSGITGCTRCIEVCSTVAISSVGDAIEVEPHLCMGCGGCATVCPSGAMRHVYPPVPDLGLRLRTLLSVFRRAGGERAAILFHDGGAGREALLQLGRHGPGLPAAVIPVDVLHIGSIGLELLLGAITYGASSAWVYSTGAEPAGYREALRQQVLLGNTILDGLGYGATRLGLLETREWPVAAQQLRALARPAPIPPPLSRCQQKSAARLTSSWIICCGTRPVPAVSISLPAGAPFGSIAVDKERCTLCMACVGACPANALLDSKQSPALRFIERNCVQCGLCVRTCPEDALTPEPRLLLDPTAKSEKTLNESVPYHCVRCGKPFATRQMIATMTAKLQGHGMFAAEGALQRLSMCADCRVIDLLRNADHGTIWDHK